MSQPTPPSVKLPSEVEAAFEALSRYDHGSPRGALMPLDRAVAASVADSPLRAELERRFIAFLRGAARLPAKKYVCRQLGLIGTAACVSILSTPLYGGALAEEARNALESLDCPEAVEAMRKALPRLFGRFLAGVITSLGVKRDFASIPLLARFLQSRDRDVAEASAVALGRMGTPEAAAALEAWEPQAHPLLKPLIRDALQACRAQAAATSPPTGPSAEPSAPAQKPLTDQPSR